MVAKKQNPPKFSPDEVMQALMLSRLPGFIARLEAMTDAVTIESSAVAFNALAEALNQLRAMKLPNADTLIQHCLHEMTVIARSRHAARMASPS